MALFRMHVEVRAWHTHLFAVCVCVCVCVSACVHECTFNSCMHVHVRREMSGMQAGRAPRLTLLASAADRQPGPTAAATSSRTAP